MALKTLKDLKPGSIIDVMGHSFEFLGVDDNGNAILNAKKMMPVSECKKICEKFGLEFNKPKPKPEDDLASYYANLMYAGGV